MIKKRYHKKLLEDLILYKLWSSIDIEKRWVKKNAHKNGIEMVTENYVNN